MGNLERKPGPLMADRRSRIRLKAAVILALTGGLTLGVLACGSDDGSPQSASNGSPTSVAASSQSSGSLVDATAANAIKNPRQPDGCTNQKSNEEICADFSNYLLSYRPAAKDENYGTRGPFLVGKWDNPSNPQEKVSSTIAIEDVRPGAGNDGKNRGWNTTAAGFSELLQVDFDDTGDIGNSGSVRIKAKAGDVDLGTAHFWLRNEDGADDDDTELNYRVDDDNDWAYCEHQLGGRPGPVYFSCGAINSATRGVHVCNDNGDDEECGFSFYLQTYPVRVEVQNKLPDSTLTITSIEQDQPDKTQDFGFEISDWASTMEGGSSLEPGAPSLWLAGFRAQAGGKVRVKGKLTATTEAAKSEAWAGQNVVMEATWGQVKVIEERDGKKTEVTKQPDPVCTIGAASSGAKASCNVDLTIGKASTPGTAVFTINK